MTQEQKIIQAKVGLLELAKQLGRSGGFNCKRCPRPIFCRHISMAGRLSRQFCKRERTPLSISSKPFSASHAPRTRLHCAPAGRLLCRRRIVSLRPISMARPMATHFSNVSSLAAC